MAAAPGRLSSAGTDMLVQDAAIGGECTFTGSVPVVTSRGGELLREAALAMRTDMLTGRLAHTVHTYPTWSAAVHMPAAQFFVDTERRSARPAAH